MAQVTRRQQTHQRGLRALLQRVADAVTCSDLRVAPVAPLVVPLHAPAGPLVRLSYAELERRIRGTVDAPVAGVVALSNVHASFERSGKSWPDSGRLFVRRPALLSMQRGDSLRLQAAKAGAVMLWVVVKVRDGGGP